MMRRIGISMRSSSAVGYNETRDAIARDWYRFMSELSIDYDWMLLPNLGEDSVAYAKHWGIEAIILTGGDDIGLDDSRDTTELLLLKHCIDNQMPVLGICRGAQLINHYFGGTLFRTDPHFHRARRHVVNLQGEVPWWHGNYQGDVNSFHTMALAAPLPEVLTSFITVGDDCEGVIHKSLNIVGVMWHPERESTASDFDRKLIHWLFS